MHTLHVNVTTELQEQAGVVGYHIVIPHSNLSVSNAFLEEVSIVTNGPPSVDWIIFIIQPGLADTRFGKVLRALSVLPKACYTGGHGVVLAAWPVDHKLLHQISQNWVRLPAGKLSTDDLVHPFFVVGLVVIDHPCEQMDMGQSLGQRERNFI